ncbi:hypothetical protein EMIHUDRAFT_97410 [Emiliania huxleyi CCMP1516]|uniref:Uncharacterized protein n=2 Tax=Emiliania huxleyi TaxID=2903 RepID=A0A0D3KZG9_EMIH1|nr:hypothetical protein EMIHUDRAFT_97410 [Emiliania huxleyi CCMP1516]EOD41154.1 hypothetical protein EMIHUDRAFT_97410 [Emiliania huxleyi CCMP1516]|eukprot:XP_005793583.1 hypothetical protein EMIHUDRAFT_97410 [Emiliania huxleyi CCMP1516]
MKVAFERTERRSSTARSARRAGCIVCIGGGLLTNLILQSHLHSTDRGFLGGVIPGLGPKRVRRWRAAVPNNSSGDGGGGGGGGGGHRKSAAAATPEDSADRVGEEELALEQTMRESETDRLGTAAANASGVGAAAGPAGGDGAGGRSISTSGYDVTLVSQTSDDRAWMVVHLAKRWGGPISIAIFCVEPEERYMQAERRRLAGIARQPGSSVAEVHGKASAGYPVNFLRNTAIARVQTSHFLLTDIDLWPSTDSYNEVLRQGAAFLRQRKLAMVLPAFEYNAGHTDYASSASRAALARALSPARQPPTAHTDTHLSTDYPRWWRATWPSLIPCFKSLRYEPYLVVPRLDTTPAARQRAPAVSGFDERFVGYGKNKIEWIQHLRFLGFVFYVLPRAFVVHCPHPPSVSRQNWQLFRDKKDELFRSFIREHLRNASIRTRMCEDANFNGMVRESAALRQGDERPATSDSAVPGASLASRGRSTGR